MVMMIIGVGVWVHYTQQAVNHAEYAAALLGPSVTAKELDRVTAALKGTASSYIIFACALFGLGLWRKLLSVEADVSGPNQKLLRIYRIVNASLHFIWWLIMVWIVVLMMGLGVFCHSIWVGNHAAKQVLTNQETMTRYPTTAALGVTADQLSKAQGDAMLAATSVKTGFPAQAVCPGTCANIAMFAFLSVDAAQACVCDKTVLQLVVGATQDALDCVAGIMVGVWFMYIFGEALRVSVACDFVHATHEAAGGTHASGGGGAPAAAAGPRGTGRGYNKI